MREYVQEQLQKNLLHDRSADNLRKNLDALNIPTQIEHYYDEKVKVYEQMRGLESEINEFMQQKLLSIKEDLLVSGGQQAKAKRTLKLCIQIDHGQP